MAGLLSSVFALLCLPVVLGRGAAAASGPPHVLVVLEENHSIGQIIGNGQAPYINSLASQYGLATNWSDLSHPSLPNYLGLVSGSIWNNPQDTTPQDQTYAGPTLVDELASAGIGWKAYMEDMPQACDLTDQFGPGNYDVNHNPFMYFNTIRNQASQCNRVVPFTQFGSDLSNNTAPPFMWVSPNTQNDMHDGTIAQGDLWLQQELAQVFASQWYTSGGTVILTWDEGETSEQVATIVISASTPPGARLTSSGNHYGTLRTLEELYGVGQLGSSSSSSNNDLLSLTGTGTPPPPTTTTTTTPATTTTTAPATTTTTAPATTTTTAPATTTTTAPATTTTTAPATTTTTAPATTTTTTVPPPASANFVQANSVAAGSPTASESLPLGTVRQGDLLVGWFLQYDSSGQVHVSDTQNGTWSRAVAEPFGGSSGDVALYYVANAHGGPTTITISADNATYLQGTASEYGGVSTTQPLAATALSAGTSSTASSGQTGSVPAGDLVYGAIQTGIAPGSLSAGSSQGVNAALRTQVSDGTDGSEDVASSAAGPQAPSMNLGTSTNWLMVAAVFTPAPAAPADTTPPSAPSITSDSVSQTLVTLNWAASTDNVGVAGYTIYRNGAALATVGSAVLSFSDNTVAPSTTYTYAIGAFDATGNQSPQSNTVTVSTPSPRHRGRPPL